MVTGDAPNTAVSIAYQAGILRKEHFFVPDGPDGENAEMVACNLRPHVMMEGSVLLCGLTGHLQRYDQLIWHLILEYSLA